MTSADRDRRIVRSLCAWFVRERRDLPWRSVGASGRRDPYRSLVSELMLQQTQVARVVEKFGPFIERFPTVHDLASAPIDDVLAMWSGLGYYRRARSLHRCAQEIVDRFGSVPENPEDLVTLPGIGRYTAGAISSIVFDRATAIVDGNVQRVLLRIDGEDLQAGSREADAVCWDRAERLVGVASRSRTTGVSAGVFNEAMMELGALVCSPGAPSCERCPLSGVCRARREGAQHRIPRPKATAAKKMLHMASLVVRDDRGRLLVERRPDAGLWPRIWQPPTLESEEQVRKSAAAKHFGVASSSLIRQDALPWETTHRSVRIVVYASDHAPPEAAGRDWVSPAALSRRALGTPQRLMLLGETDGG